MTLATTPLSNTDHPSQNAPPRPAVNPESLLSIGTRLCKEGKRLQLHAYQLCELCGKPAKTVKKWLAGEKLPNAYELALLAKAGVDVHYVLTGHSNLLLRRLQFNGHSALGTLTPEQEAEINDPEREIISL